MATNKVIYGNQTLIDTTGDTADVSDVKAGETFHSRSGAQLTGTMVTSPKNIWYGTCLTEYNVADKVVTTTTGDFVLAEGNMIRVRFRASMQTAWATLSIDGSTAKRINYEEGMSAPAYYWAAGEVIDFVYDGTAFIMSDGSRANTVFYGITKLSSLVSSTSELEAATPYAVKQAYDLANGKQDELVSGTNIKTVNNQSLLGSGNIDIGAGDSGSNYCKLPDGTLICWGSYSASSVWSTSFSFAKTFASAPILLATPAVNNTSIKWITQTATSTTGGQIWYNNANSVAVDVKWLAIGRWK